MKTFQSIWAFGLSLVMLSACDSDLETVTYHSEQAQPAVLQQLEAAYVLDVKQSDEVAMTIQWAKPDMGYAASVTTSLEMDIKGKNFSKAVILASSKTNTSCEVITSDLNSKITTLLEKQELPFGAVDVEFRVVSSISDAAKSVYSAVMTTHITPYAGEREYPQLYVVGDYCGWANPDNSFAQCQHLYSEQSNETYEGWIVFGEKAANGWKITPKASWDTAWGYDGEWTGASSLTLATGMGDIKCFDGFSYKYSFNTTTLELKTLASVKIWGVVGGHNNWGNDASVVPDTPMAYTTETDAKGKVQPLLSATVEMAAGNTFKMRADGDWTNQVAPNAVDGDFEVDGDNFKVSEAGTYTIKWYFNKVKGRLTVTKQ